MISPEYGDAEARRNEPQSLANLETSSNLKPLHSVVLTLTRFHHQILGLGDHKWI